MVVSSHLKSFQAVELAVRTGSLKKAAEILSITPAAVGQRIKTLEDYLGVDLLVRGRSGVGPTPELAGAMAHLRAAFRDLDAAANLLDLQRTTEIHVAAISDFANLWLKPRLAGFRAAHPNIRFCINGEGDAPMRLGQADCEISFTARRDDNRADILFRDYLLPLGSPENVARIAKVPAAERLEGFPLLHLDLYRNDHVAIGWPDWIEAHGFRRTAPNRGIRFQRLAPALEAVLSNAGLMIGGLALISDVVDDGRLSLPFPMTTGAWTDHAYQARFRAETFIRPPVRRFRDWLLAESGKTRDWLARRAPAAP